MAIKDELLMLAHRHKGLLKPKNVVDYARNEKTALHSCFEWDDSKAAEQHRLWQARQLLTVYVTVIEENHKTIPIFVSLRDDRIKPGGGYRLLADVMNNKKRYAQFVGEAYRDMLTFKSKYETLLTAKPVLGKYIEKSISELTKLSQPQPKAVKKAV